MPGLDACSLRDVLDLSIDSEADVVLPETEGKAQPLCALYHKGALAAIRKALESGCRKITEAIAPLRVIVRDTGNAGLFRNVNTPAEWQAVLGR